MAKYSREELLAKIKEIEARDAAYREDQKLADDLEAKTETAAKAQRERNRKLEGAMVKVKRVIDGDTFEDDQGTKFRVKGIDAPESRENKKLYWDSIRSGKDPEDIMKAGKASTERFQKLVGEQVRVSNVTKEGYGRALAYLENEKGQDVGLEMIKSGDAEPTKRWGHERLTKYFMEYSGIPMAADVKTAREEVKKEADKVQAETKQTESFTSSLRKKLFNLPEAGADTGKTEAQVKPIEERNLSMLDRVFSLASAGSTENALYNLVTTKEKTLGTYTKFFTDWNQDVKDKVVAGFTGKEKGPVKKTFTDILKDTGTLESTPGKFEAIDVLGPIGSMLTDPATFGASMFRPMISTAKAMGTSLFKTGKYSLPGIPPLPWTGKPPSINMGTVYDLPVVGGAFTKGKELWDQGADFLGRKFNKFHDIEKQLNQPADVASQGIFPNAPMSEWFKNLYTEAVNTGKIGEFKQNWTKVGEGLQQAGSTGPGDAIMNFLGGRHGRLRSDESTWGGRALNAYDDLTDKWKTSVTSIWPQFHIRNAYDSMMKNFTDGVGIKDYAKGWDILRGGSSSAGGLDADKIRWFAKISGVTGSKGAMTDIGGQKAFQEFSGIKDLAKYVTTGDDGFWKKLANVGGYVTTSIENAFRMPHFVSRLEKNLYEGAAVGQKASQPAQGLMWKSSKETADTHIKYGSEFMTDFEQQLQRLVPFYQFQKGSALKWGGDIAEGKLDRLSIIDKWRDKDDDKPSFMKNMLTFGGLGGGGSSLEDFSQIWDQPIKSLATKLNLLIEKPAEWMANWNVLKGQTIDSDTLAGKRYKEAPGVVQSLVGFQAPNQVDSTAKWLFEAISGRFGSAMTTPGAKDEPWYRQFMPIRDYSTTPEQKQMYKDLDAKKDAREYSGTVSGIVSYVMGLFQTEVAKASAAGVGSPQQRFAWVTDPSIARAYEKSQNQPAGSYGAVAPPWEPTPGGVRARMDRSQRLNEEWWKMGGPYAGSTDLIGRSAFRHGEIPAMRMEYEGAMVGENAEVTKKRVDDARSEAELRRVRGINEPQLWDWRHFAGRKPGMGNMDESQWLATQQQNITSFTSKTEEIARSGMPLSPTRIREEAAASMRAADYAKKTSYISPEQYNERIAAIMGRAEEQMDKFERKRETTIADTMKNYADGMVESEAKIYALRDAALMKWESSEEAHVMKFAAKHATTEEEKLKYEEDLNERRFSIMAEYEGKAKEYRVKMARETAIAQDAISRDRLRAALSIAELQMQKGEIVLTQYITKGEEQIKANFADAINTAKAAVAAATAEGNAEEVLQAERRLSQLNADLQKQLSDWEIKGMEMRRQLDINKAQVQQMISKETMATGWGMALPERRERDWGEIEKSFRSETDSGFAKIEKDMVGASDTEKEEKMMEYAEARNKRLVEERAKYERESLKQLSSGYGEFFGETARMFEEFYNASGKKSKEFFILMKSMQLAQAIISGVGATISAYEKGMQLGSMPLAIAWAAVAAAFAGAQVGVIASQMFKEGGEVAGPGGVDAVPARLTAGEFVMTTKAVDTYGVDFMHAINKGMFPEITSIASIPTPKTHFADGGPVVSDSSSELSTTEDRIAIYNVIDPALMERYQTSAPGQKNLLNVISHNKYEIRQILSQ